MKKRDAQKILAGFLCASVLAVNSGVGAVCAAEAEKIEEEQNVEEEQNIDELETAAENTEETAGEETELSEPEETKVPYADGETVSGNVSAENISDDGSDAVISGTVDESYGKITWKIDRNGKLTVEGSGDYAEPGKYPRSAPWSRYDTSMIVSAEINVTGMTDASCMFCSNCTNLVSVDLSNFDTSQVTDTAEMFSGCSSLQELNLSSFDTSQVTDMKAMFSGCSSLQELDLSGFDTSQVTDMNYMFGGCSSLRNLNVSSFNTGKVTNMYRMFGFCRSLQELNLSNFNTSQVTTTNMMFEDCSNLQELDLSSFDTGRLENMTGMFENCSSLQKLNVSSFDTSKVSSMDYTFSGCSSLQELDLSSFSMGQVYGDNLKYMFSGCHKLAYMKTPYNLFQTVELPQGDSKAVWHLPDGTKITSLPCLPYSVEIRKDELSEDPEPAVYTVSFNLQGHGSLADVTVVSGGKIEKPADPTAAGYTFTGWYKEAECRTPWNFETDTVEADTVLYAGWNPEVPKDDDSQGILPEDLPADGRIPQGLWIAGLKGSYDYTGKAVKPSVRVYNHDCRLREGQDYTVSYKNNIHANHSSDPSPTVIVKGKGNYTGTETAEFRIQAVHLDEIETENITSAYNGKEQKPVPVLIYNGRKLRKDKDFTVDYTDKKDGAYKAAGTYEIVLTGTGNFTGTRTIEQIITDKTLISRVKVKKIPNQPYGDGKEKTPKPEVSMNGVLLAEGTDYTVRYEDNIETGTAAAVLTGIGDYAGTKKVTFKITGTALKSAAVEIAGGVHTYTGMALKPDVTVTSDGKRLTKGTDYEVSYSNHTNAGTAAVTVRGIGAYTGTVKKTFKINACDLNEVQASGWEKPVKYLKGGSTAQIKLMFAGKELVEGKDYTVSCRNNKTLSEGKQPTMTVKGKGNFKGKITKEFTITDKALNDSEAPVTLTVPDVGYVNRAGKYISKPVLTDADGKTLTIGKDYEKAVVYTDKDGRELTKQDIVEKGAVITVTVKGKGAYSGELKTTYRITEESFGKAKISIKPQEYTGRAVLLNEKDITVKIGGKILIPGTDYKIMEGSYVNHVKKGTAGVTIIGQGTYGGTKKAKFKIVSKLFAWQR